jgi:hypothetical protein
MRASIPVDADGNLSFAGKYSPDGGHQGKTNNIPQTEAKNCHENITTCIAGLRYARRKK